MFITFFKTKNTCTPSPKRDTQISFEDFLLEIPQDEIIEEPPQITEEPKRITVNKDKESLRYFFIDHYEDSWANIPTPPAWPVSEIKQHYHSFKIPKKSGGLRQIDAPDDELKTYLTQLKLYFENNLKILTHESAHAYVKGRSTITDLKVHQAAESNWFLKLDLKDFFPAHNLEYTIKMLENIYPIGFLLEFPKYKETLTNALRYAFLDDKLPQGTPFSPTLTNLLMVPIDYTTQHKLWDMKNRFVYTRYADDMTISSIYKFDWRKVQNEIESTLTTFETPFKVKTEKTHFGSKSGRNWNFGIMLNKDNRMTIGHKKNQQFRAMLNNIMQDYKNDVKWSLEDRQALGGLISYYKAVDPEYIQAVITRYEEKFGLSLRAILKE